MNVEITKGWDGDDVVANLGNADGWEDAASLVRTWAEARMPYVPPVWTITKIVDLPRCVVDFGSHVYFARYMGVPE